MLFRKKIEPLCAYCKHGSPLDEDSVLCFRRGVVFVWQSCRRFAYDPLKREPEIQPAPVTDVDKDVFILDENKNSAEKST